MKVGDLDETLTVTGASPVVDVQNAQVQQQITRETLDLLPTGRSAWSLAKVLPGITSTGTDVGGSGGFQSLTVNVHGSKGDNVYQIDGMTVQSGIGNGTAPQYYNDGQFEEYTYTTSAIPAEVAYGGVRIQMTSRDGGNEFKGYGLGQYAKWQSDNYSSELQDAGLRTPDQTIRIWDTQASLGGPIMRDKLWFFFTNRYNGGDFLIGNSFYINPAQCTDLERPYDCQGIDDNWIQSAVGRVTYQATPRNKIAAFYSSENKFRGHREIAAGVSPEATTPQVTNLSYAAQLKWTAPLTDRFMLDVGVSQVLPELRLHVSGQRAAERCCEDRPDAADDLGRAAGRILHARRIQALLDGQCRLRDGCAQFQGRHSIQPGHRVPRSTTSGLATSFSSTAPASRRRCSPTTRPSTTSPATMNSAGSCRTAGRSIA